MIFRFSRIAAQFGRDGFAGNFVEHVPTHNADPLARFEIFVRCDGIANAKQLGELLKARGFKGDIVALAVKYLEQLLAATFEQIAERLWIAGQEFLVCRLISLK